MFSFIIVVVISVILPLYFRKSPVIRVSCVLVLANILIICFLVWPNAVSRGLLKDETRMHDEGFLLGVREMRDGMEARAPILIVPVIALAVLSVVAMKPKKADKTD